MQFSTVVFALAAAAVAFAADITVLVGDTGLEYNPPSVTAQNGDTIIFEFRSKNHTVTQSTFTNPCTPVTTPSAGVNSGFQFVNSTTAPFPTWSITIDDASAPLWFFCAQTVPANHCQSGMVFAINPTAEKSFTAYQANAKNSTQSTAPSASSSSPAVSGAATATETGSVLPATVSGASTGTSSGLTFSTIVSGAAGTLTSGSPTSATLGAQSVVPTSNGAMRVGSSASSLLALAGLLAGLML
ncbi:hypothetical protein H0H87_003214 [Tephrocybe sp. NHM501043]|nr:hypothetical protein H0H87_003214 [Tephrocybe sp. NHM501043]